MALNLGELSVKLSADMSQFTATLNSAQRSISTSGAKMQKQFDGFAEATSGLLLPVGKLTDKLETTVKASDKAGSGMQQMGRHMHGAQQSAHGLAGTLGDMSTQMNLLMGGAALSATFTAPFAMMTRAAFDTSIGFESAFAGVRKTVEATEEEFAELEKRFRSMSKTTPIAAEEFARIGELAGQLGVRGVDNLSAFSDTIAKLAVTTNLSTEEAATSLARFANIMQMPMGQVDRLGSTIVDLGNNFATTEQEITQFGLRIAGAGKQIGLSESEILAFGTALSSVGINAEMGGTAISRVFAELAKVISKGGEDLEMFASVAGMSAETFAQAFRDDAAMASIAFIEGLDEIKNAGGNVFRVLESLNLENERVRSTLLRTSGAGDVLRRSIELSSKAWEENTALTIEAEKRFKTTESQIKIMQNNFKEAARSIGDTFAPALNTAVDVFKSVAEAAQGMPPGLQVLVTAFGGLLAAIGPAMLALAGFGAAAAGIKVALPILAGAFVGTAGTITLAVAAVAGLVAALGVFAVKQKEARIEAQKQAENLVKLSGQYKQLTEKVNDSTASEEEHNQAVEAQKKLMQEIGAAFPGLVAEWDKYGNVLVINTKLLNEDTDAAKRNAQTVLDDQEKATRAVISNTKQRIDQLREERAKAEEATGAIARAYASAFNMNPGDLGNQFDVIAGSPRSDDFKRKFDAMIAEQQRELAKASAELAEVYRQRSEMDPLSYSLLVDGPRVVVPKGGTDGNKGGDGETVDQASAADLLTRALERLDSEFKINTLRMEDASSISAELTRQQDYLRTRSELLSEQVAALSSEYEKSAAKLGPNAKKTLDLASALDKVKLQAAENEAAIRDAIPKATATDLLTHSLQQLDTQFQINAARMGEAGKTAEGLNQKHEYLRSRSALLEKQVASLTEKYQESVRVLGPTAVKTLELASALDKAKLEAAQNEAAIRDNALAFSEVQGPIKEAKDNLAAATKEVQGMKNWLETLSDRLDAAKNAFDKTGKAIKEVEDSTKEAQQGISSALGVMADRIKDVDEEIKELTDSTKDAQQGISNALGVMADRIKDVDEEIKELNSSTKEAQQGISSALGVMANRIKDVDEEMRELKSSSKDAQQGISDAFSAMGDSIKDVGRQISDARSAMRDLANVRLVGEGAVDKELEDLKRREALVKLAINQLKRSGVTGKDSRLIDLEKQLDQLGLLKENIELKREVDFAPLRNELKRMVDDTKEMSFADAAAGINAHRKQIEELTAKQTSMTTQMESLRASFGDLIPSISRSNMTFDQAAGSVSLHAATIDSNNLKLTELTAKQRNMTAELETLRKSVSNLVPKIGDADLSFEEAKIRVDEFRTKIEENNVKVGELTTKQQEMTAELETLRKSVSDLVPKIGDADISFDEAKKRVDEFRTKIEENNVKLGELTIKQQGMTTELETLRKSVANLVPKIGDADISFDEAKTRIDEFRAKIEENNAKLGGPDGLIALQEKQKGVVSLLTEELDKYKGKLNDLTSAESAAASALEALRSAALAAAQEMSNRSTSNSFGGTTGPQGFGITPFAKGGIARETIFAAGDAGPEVIAPLSKLPDLMAPMVGRVMSLVSGFGFGGGGMEPAAQAALAGVGGGNVFDVFVQIGDQPFEDAVVRVQERSKRRGRS